MAEEKEQAAAVESEEETVKSAANENGETPEGETSEEGKTSEEADELTQEEQELLQSLTDTVDLENENSELKDQLLRKQADFDNFRKRIFREKEEAIKYANSNLLSDLVSVIDDFERAIGSAEDSDDFDSFLSGFRLIEKQFVGMLERNWGLKRMETVGKEFDPQEHEALMMEECEDCSTQTVIEDYQKGYFLHDRVLRHAKVKVGIPMTEEKEEEQEAGEKVK
ncbi:MAG: nucleotide exchange factor GrpE [Spirochaetales bacterium]|nr:nucleotide exchange factor GrpE [Spirochaetales bacterium]